MRLSEETMVSTSMLLEEVRRNAREGLGDKSSSNMGAVLYISSE